MGLGPSIKMTTLHHYRCPITKLLAADQDLEFLGIVVDGVSESYDDKIYSAIRTGFLAEGMRADGAIVAIDGWGNHHIDFVNVIEQLGSKGIPTVGTSYIGLQGRLVCSSPYVGAIVDFNKSSSGYESCVVGQNNLTELDAFKAIALLKHRMKQVRNRPVLTTQPDCPAILRTLTRKTLPVRELRFGPKTALSDGVLTIREGLERRILGHQPRLRGITVQIIPPEAHNRFVNSNLDFAPIAVKAKGGLGEGVTHLLGGVTMMLTGVEEGSGFQPSNIGSSEGLLKDQVVLDQAGTPASTDSILHIDCLFREGEGRTAEGLQAAHGAADQILEEIRAVLRDWQGTGVLEEFQDIARPGKKKVLLIKIVSGLGNMYDTALFPNEPGGYLGSRQMMSIRNMPIYLTPNQCRDGAIHSLL